MSLGLPVATLPITGIRGDTQTTLPVTPTLNTFDWAGEEAQSQSSGGFWDLLDVVTVPVQNALGTVANAWANEQAGNFGAESNWTSQGVVSDQPTQGQQNRDSGSFFERNKTALMIGSAALVGVLAIVALKK